MRKIMKLIFAALLSLAAGTAFAAELTRLRRLDGRLAIKGLAVPLSGRPYLFEAVRPKA